MTTMRDRCLALAAKWTPVGCTVTYRKSLSGMAWPTLNKMSVPNPVTRKALYIYLHECAHLHLHHGSKKKRHVEEMEAEQWAHARMREAHIPVPRAMTKRAKDYVARKIDQALVRGAKHIDRRAAAYAGLPTKNLYTVEVDTTLTAAQLKHLEPFASWLIQRFERRPSGQRFWKLTADKVEEFNGNYVEVEAAIINKAVALAKQKLEMTQ